MLSFNMTKEEAKVALTLLINHADDYHLELVNTVDFEDKTWLLCVCRDVLKRRWPEAEAVLLKHPYYAYYYALEVIQGRWPEAEKLLVNQPVYAKAYAESVLHQRWPEAEKAIARDPHVAIDYSRHFIAEGWSKDVSVFNYDDWTYRYALNILIGNTSDFEEIYDEGTATLQARQAYLRGLWDL